MTKGLKIEKMFRLPLAPSAVWKSLVNPSLIQAYNCNCELAASLPSLKSIEQCPGFCSGGILELEEGRRVKFSTFDPAAGLKDQPQNYLHITYLLTPIANGTELSVVIENYMEEEQRYEYSSAGWNQTVLPALQNLTRN